MLGASLADIVKMLTTHFLWPVGLAILLATPVAWYFMNGWLQDFVYRTTVPWWIFGFCGLAAVVLVIRHFEADLLGLAGLPGFPGLPGFAGLR